MAGQILVDVLTLDGEGLVGFTKIGQQISLKEISHGEALRSEKDEIVQELAPGEYILFQKPDEVVSKYFIYEVRTD